MCAALRSHDPHRIGAALLLYDHAAGVRLPGLTRRRQLEAAPWLRPIGRFEDYSTIERHLIEAVDRLRGHHSPAAADRRLRLQLAIVKQTRRLARRARVEHDWLVQRRTVRRAALRRRLAHAHGGTA